MYADAAYYHGLAFLDEKRMEEARESFENCLIHANKVFGEDAYSCSKYNVAFAKYYIA